MKALRVCFVLSLALGSLALAQLGSPAAKLVGQFEASVRTHYWNPKLLDIAALRQKLFNGLNAQCAGAGEQCAASRLYPVLQKLVRELPDKHSSFRTPQEASTSDNDTLSLGLALRFDVVQRLAPNGPAEKAGVLVGDRVLEMSQNGTNVARRNAGWAKPDAVTMRLQRSSLGDFGVVESNKTTLSLKASPQKGWVATLQKPSLDWIDGDIALVGVPSFAFEGAGEMLHAVLAQTQEARATILDLRGNEGGLLDETALALGAFGDAAVFAMRGNKELQLFRYAGGKLLVVGEKTRTVSLLQPTHFAGKLLLLVGRDTTSAGEVFAQIAARMTQAVSVGEASRGLGNSAVLPIRLFDQSELRLTAARLETPSGAPLAERFVPDVLVKESSETLMQQDAVLERALALLQNENASNTPK